MLSAVIQPAMYLTVLSHWKPPALGCLWHGCTGCAYCKARPEPGWRPQGSGSCLGSPGAGAGRGRIGRCRGFGTATFFNHLVHFLQDPSSTAVSRGTFPRPPSPASLQQATQRGSVWVSSPCAQTCQLVLMSMAPVLLWPVLIAFQIQVQHHVTVWLSAGLAKKPISWGYLSPTLISHTCYLICVWEVELHSYCPGHGLLP